MFSIFFRQTSCFTRMIPLIVQKYAPKMCPRLSTKFFLGQCASHDVVVTQFSHCVKLASKPSPVPGGLVVTLNLCKKLEAGEISGSVQSSSRSTNF